MASFPVPMTAWDSFCEAVLGDPELQRQLLATPDRRDFVDKAVELASAVGCAVRPADVEEALRARRQAWLERWI